MVERLEVPPERAPTVVERLDTFFGRASAWLAIVAGVALVLVMLLTAADIIGRAFRMPIPGTFEIVSFAGGLVVGLAVPLTTRAKAHVFVDLLITRVSGPTRSVLTVATRLLSAVIFLIMSYSIVRIAFRILESQEVTPVLHLPFYPVALAMGVAFFVEAVLLVLEAFGAGRRAHG
ncbi:MAG: TRAP transporter small permease [Deltaproteobacteria bacterium]|nr:TRAP transporter small permease [Deltaproteobacteria bacterium]